MKDTDNIYFSEAELKDLYDACYLVMTAISEKLETNPSWTPEERAGLRQDYNRFTILSGKIGEVAWDHGE